MNKVIVLLLSILFLVESVLANEVNIFSARHYDSDVHLYQKFTAKHGIKVASPVTPYNKELRGIENVLMFETKQELANIIKQFSLPHIFNV